MAQESDREKGGERSTGKDLSTHHPDISSGFQFSIHKESPKVRVHLQVWCTSKIHIRFQAYSWYDGVHL